MNYKWHTKLYGLVKSNLYRRVVMRLDVSAVKLKRKLFPSKNNMKYYHGANWFDITHKLAVDLVSHTEEILKNYKNGFCIDEVFLQTFVVNHGYLENVYSPSNSEIRSSIKREIDWNRGNPYTWKSNDIDYLKSSDCLFVRKVDEKVDEKLIESLEQILVKN